MTLRFPHNYGLHRNGAFLERTVTTHEDCKREVRIQLTEADLKPHYEEAYRQAQAGISLPGFRKGKVPISVIKQRMGRQIEQEALESIADAEFRSFATQEDIHVVGHPALTDVQKSSDGVAFVIEYEVMPSVEIGNYRGLVVDRPIREVTEEDVQQEIDRLCLRLATFEPAEKVTDTMYIVAFTMHELDKETSMPMIGAEAKEDKVFLDDDDVDMHLRNSLSDATVGATFTYVAETEDANAQPPSYRVTVTEIQKVVPAEFTNALVQRITNDQMNTTEELREDIHKQLTAYMERAQRESMENQVVNQLVQSHDFPVPESLVHAVVHQLFDDFKKRNEGVPGIDKLNAHELEHEFRPAAERIAKWELLRQEIIRAENLTVEDADVEEAAARYGIGADQMRMAVKQNRNLNDTLLSEKAMKVLLDYAIINDVAAPTN
ncbi:MAG: trigger factor [Bradyrhizobiaceae bacterium]|nr:trigger factor [Bradyrhizobiaceae bacterium]